MGWAECCDISTGDENRQRVRAADPPPTAANGAVPSGTPTSAPWASRPSLVHQASRRNSVNVGIGSVAAGEVELDELSQTSARSNTSHGGFGIQPGGKRVPSPPAVVTGDELMPFRRQRTEGRALGDLKSRKSISCMEHYLVDEEKEVAGTMGRRPSEWAPANGVHVGALVMRGPDWKWGNEDGGPGRAGPGTVLSIDPRTQTAEVLWSATGKQLGHYRCGRFNDILLAKDAPPVEDDVDPLRRACTAKDLFADIKQTCIIFDWDDTLFPTTYVRDDLRLDWRRPLKGQRIAAKQKEEIGEALAKCTENACASLRTAAALGKVVLVTLARSPWVKDSCANFVPQIGALIEELRIPVIYAQEGQHIEYSKLEMSSNEAVERFWSEVKGRAIALELTSFYSQYEGQSWKNIISIGDSDFERLGTQQATEGYMKQAGIDTTNGVMRQKTIEVKGKVYKVRTKTFKMLDQPTVGELTVQLAMLERWLPLLVKLDGSCDVDLNDIEDPATIERIEKTLRGQVPVQ